MGSVVVTGEATNLTFIGNLIFKRLQVILRSLIWLCQIDTEVTKKALSVTFILIVSSYVGLMGSSLRSDQTVANILKGMGYKMDYAIPKQIVSLLRKTQHLAVLQGAEFTGIVL